LCFATLQNDFVMSHGVFVILQAGKILPSIDGHLASAPAQTQAFAPLASGRGHFNYGI
jgi:hypothetical protein